MCQNYQPTLFPFKNLPMILNVMLPSFLPIVFFRNKARGGGLDLLRKEAAFTTLIYPKTLEENCFFLVPQIKMPFGCIIYA